MAATTQWELVDVRLHSEQSGGVLLVSGVLPESARLPAQVELSVPAGSELQWAGEILGGDPSADPEAKTVKSTVGASDVYRFTLTKARTGQIEVATGAVKFDGTTYESQLKWTAVKGAPEVRLAVRVPQNSKILTPVAGASLQPAGAGYSVYLKSFKSVKAGAELDLSFDYAPGAAAPAGGGSPQGSTALVFGILVGVLGVIVLLVILLKRSAQQGAHPEAQPTEKKVRPSASVSGSTEAAFGESAPEEEVILVEDDDDEDHTRPRNTKRAVVTAVIVGIVVLAGIGLGAQTTRPQVEGDSISQTFTAGDPCATANIELAVPAGADHRAIADKVFAALSTVEGMNTVTYRLKTGVLEAGYCESKTTEDAVRKALIPTGLLAAGAK